MSQWYLLNKVTIGSRIVNPGTFYDDAVTSTASVLSAGGVLWPASDTTVATAAKSVQNAHQKRGMNAEEMERLMFVAALSGTRLGAATQKMVVDIPLTTIQAQTSGTAFNVGAALPANARLISAEIDVVTPISGGTLSAVTAALQGGSDAAGSILGAVSVFTGAAASNSKPGSNPYPNRGGQQLKMTLTTTGDTCANAAAGHLSLVVFYEIVP